MRSSFYSHHILPEHPLRSNSGEPGERNRLHTPSLAGRPVNYGSHRSQKSQRPAVEAPHLCDHQSEGALPEGGATFLPPCQGAPTLPSSPAPHHEEALRKHPAPGRPVSARPACPIPTSSHAPEPTGATTHPTLQGRGSPGRPRAAPPQRVRQRGS